MKHFPIFFSGRIPLADIVEALASKGIHVRGELGGRMVADQIPAFLRTGSRGELPAADNVRPIKTRSKR